MRFPAAVQTRDHLVDGVQTIAFDVAGDRIAAIYVMRNPDKLRHLA